MNRLHYGDCLTVMQGMALGSVDLIYLDPPFNSNRDYNAIYKDETGRQLPDQIEAFCDTWILDEERERTIRRMPVMMRDAGIDDDVAQFWQHWMNALRKTNPRLLAYLSYMVQRLLPMKGILKPTGSIYLHCDPTASHYIKVMMDSMFGHDNFRNEIIWRRMSGGKENSDQYGRNSDRILFYSNSKTMTFHAPRAKHHNEGTVRDWYNKTDNKGRYVSRPLLAKGIRKGDSGQIWRGLSPNGHWIVPKLLHDRYEQEFGVPLSGSVRERLDKLADSGFIDFNSKGNPSWRRYLHEATLPRIDDIWADEEVKGIGRTSRERMGYETQKPLALLERIIATSSNPGETVFDPFCGCATTIEAAHKLGRRWIGCDIAIHAIKRVAKVRLEDRLNLVEGEDFTIEGVPQNAEGARDLWERDKYHFQKWAVEQVDGFVTTRRTGDGGIDGRLYFVEPGQRDLRSMVLEVKGGRNVGIGTVRDLRGVLERDMASMAGLIVMDDPGPRKRANFAREMAAAGDLDVFGTLYPRMQMLTVEEILDGKRFQTPGVVGQSTGQGALALPR